MKLGVGCLVFGVWFTCKKRRMMFLSYVANGLLVRLGDGQEEKGGKESN